MSESDLRVRRETLFVATLLILASVITVFPFMDAIVLAITTAYLLALLHQRIAKVIRSELLSTFIIISGLFSVITAGLYLFMNNIFGIISRLNTFATEMEEAVLLFVEPLNLPAYIQGSISDFFDEASVFATDILLGVLTSTPSFLIHVGIYLVTTIYLYKDRKKIYSSLVSVIDDLPNSESRIINSLLDSIDSIFKGVFLTQIMVASLMGIAAAAGFYAISLLTSPIPLIPLWAVLIGVFAIIPVIAAFMVYAPLGMYYIIVAEPLKGSMILIYGVLVLQILPEILFRPWVGSKNLNEHPLIIFIGFIAGPLVLGVKGIILGPLILILTKEFILNYAELVSSPE